MIIEIMWNSIILSEYLEIDFFSPQLGRIVLFTRGSSFSWLLKSIVLSESYFVLNEMCMSNVNNEANTHLFPPNRSKGTCNTVL